MLTTPTLKWPFGAISPHLLCNFLSLNCSTVYIFYIYYLLIGLFHISCIVFMYFCTYFMRITALLFWRNKGIIIINNSNNYLSSSFNCGSVLQEKFNDFDSVFLARNVQRCETVLCANKLHLHIDDHQ